MIPSDGLKTQDGQHTKKHIKTCYHENLFKKSSFNIRTQKRDLLMRI
jgi:hypothetical protein